MTTPLVDVSGNAIPTRQEHSEIQRVLSIPPVRNVPNPNATEFLWSGYISIPPGGAPVVLNDGLGGIFQPVVPNGFRGRIDYFIVNCPDLVAATNPYILWRLQFNQTPVNAWGTVALMPDIGSRSNVFAATVDIPPNTTASLLALNQDVAAHFLSIFIHGWTWPTDLLEE